MYRDEFGLYKMYKCAPMSLVDLHENQKRRTNNCFQLDQFEG